MKQAAVETKNENRSENLLARGVLQRPTINRVAEYAMPSRPTRNSVGARFNQDFSRVKARSRTCPLFPRRCPFGGACHNCPVRLQTKLKINQPGDKYEQEADRIAEQVMRMREIGSSLFSQSNFVNSSPTFTVGGAEPTVQNVDGVRFARSGPFDNLDQSHSDVWRHWAGRAPQVPPTARDVLARAGQSLDVPTRDAMQQSFGCDFSKVRIHTGAHAAEAARSINALAFTFGNEIVFGQQQYAARSAAGARLLAHELAHVAQSRVPNDAVPVGIGSPLSPLERDAEQAAVAATSGRPARVRMASAAFDLRRTIGRVTTMEEEIEQFLRDMPARTLAQAADRVATLLDAATMNTREREILAILSSLSPSQFAQVMTILAGRSSGGPTYLARLYSDLHGAEFRAYIALSNAKLIAARAGSITNLAATVEGLESGRLSAGSQTYAPFRFTSPSTFRSYPESARYDSSGRLLVSWRTHRGLLDVRGSAERIELGSTDLLTVRHRHTGAVMVLSAAGVHALTDDYVLGARLAEASVVLIAAGGASAIAAETTTARTSILGLQVVLPAAGQFIAENREAIMQMPGGPAFLRAWQVFNIALGAYGLAQIARSGVGVVRNLRGSADNLIRRNPGNSIARSARDHVNNVIPIASHPEFVSAGPRVAGAPPSTPQAFAARGSLALETRPSPKAEAQVIPLTRPAVPPQVAPAATSEFTTASQWINASAAAITNAMANNDGLSDDSLLPFHWHKPMVDSLYPRHLSIPNAITPNTLDRDNGPTPVTYHFRRRSVTENFGIDPIFRPWPGKTFQYIPSPGPRRDPERARFLRTMNNLGYDRSGQQMDHVHEYQFGGPDHFSNIWPADTSMNRRG